MPFIIMALFFMLPVLEIAVFIIVGDEIGVLATLALCILSAAIGWIIVQKQGFDTLLRGRAALQTGHFPGQAMFDGVCIVLAGALLILPGFVSDAIGFALLIPPVRAGLRHFLGRHVDVRTATTATYGPSQTARDTGVVEGTFERIDDVPGNNPRLGS